MRKRLGIAVAGAVLGAGLLGGASFGASPAAPFLKCASFERRIDVLSGAASVAAANGNQARADAINARIAALVAKKTAAGC
jgi:hypothetical protein